MARGFLNRRSIGNRTDASHVLGHGRGLIVLVIPLRIVILDLRRKSFGQLVTKDDDNLVVAVDCLRVVRRRIGAVQSKLVWTGGDGGITKRPRENVAFARGKRIVSREVGLSAEIRVYSHAINIHRFTGYAFPVIVGGITSAARENGARSGNWVAISRNHALVVIIPRVFGKQTHLCPERVVRIEAIVVRNIFQYAIQEIRTDSGHGASKEIERCEAVGSGRPVEIVLHGAPECGERDLVGGAILDQSVSAVPQARSLVKPS